jgi:hypothetical protein
MKIEEEFQNSFKDKEEGKQLCTLILKLEKFARKQFYLHWFRGRPAGIPPSGDDYNDFVIRAFIHCYPTDGRLKIDRKFVSKLYQYIFREISRESRLIINNLVKNETDYAHDHTDDESYQNPIQLAQNNEVLVKERLFKQDVRRIIKEIISEFRQYIKDLKFKMIVELFNAPRASFERMLTKVTDHPVALINELINSDIIIDDSGLMTEKCQQLDRPCKLKIKFRLKGKRGKSHLFCILKMNGQFTVPRFNAHYLGITEEKYYYHVRMLREHFKRFINEWKTRGNNAEILEELGLFQDT